MNGLNVYFREWDMLGGEPIPKFFIFDIVVMIEIKEVPNELILNWDHTGIIMFQKVIELWLK